MSLWEKGDPVHDGGMNTIMDGLQITTIEQFRQFVAGSVAMKMSISRKAECYEWVRATLIRASYQTAKKAERRILRSYFRRGAGAPAPRPPG